MQDNRNKVFIDSNVLIYAYSNSEQAKQQVARQIVKENYTVISTQVLQEISNTLYRKFWDKNGIKWDNLNCTIHY